MRSWAVSGVFCFVVVHALADYYQNSNYFCNDLQLQEVVDISQLEGIWYVIEKLIHTEERRYTVNLTSCPVIHISQDHRHHTTTRNPLYKSYDTTYSSGYPHNNRNPTDPQSHYITDQEQMQQQQLYDRLTTYDYERRNSQIFRKQHLALKYLRIYWDDNTYSREYYVRYNVTKSGFWIMSESEVESPPHDSKHFVGTVQVIKAVGNHLALNFCKRLPEQKQHFSVILSRENILDSRDIHNVHGILIRKGLSTSALERSCNAADFIKMNYLVVLITLGLFLFLK